MRTRALLLILVAACGSKSTPEAGSGATSAPTGSGSAGSAPQLARRDLDCAGVISGSQAATGAPISPGWGAVPAALRILPPNGELCGSGTVNGHAAAFVRSPLFGQQLADLYAPVGGRGCTPKVDINGNDTVQISMVTVRCTGAPEFVAVTDSTYGFYSVQAY
jgi:hypothetical protein